MLEPGGGPAGSLRRWLPAFGALVVTVVILAVAALAGEAAGRVFASQVGLATPRAFSGGEREALSTAQLAIFLLVFQAAVAALTFAAASRWAGTGAERLLPFDNSPGGIGGIVRNAGLLLVLAGLYGVAVMAVDRTALLHDLKPFVAEMKSRTWGLMFVASAIGAPVAEEILFRGFLFGALRASPVGVIGAGLVTSVVWASLHANYSIYGMAAIFLIGLYLAALRQRTGSLIAPIACHAAYNASIVLALAFIPEPMLGLG